MYLFVISLSSSLLLLFWVWYRMVQNVDYNNCLMRYGRIRFSCARALCEQKYSFALVLFVFDTLSYTLLYLYRTVFSVLCDIRTKRSNSGVSHIIDTNSMCAIVYFRLRYMLQQQWTVCDTLVFGLLLLFLSLSHLPGPLLCLHQI